MVSSKKILDPPNDCVVVITGKHLKKMEKVIYKLYLKMICIKQSEESEV